VIVKHGLRVVARRAAIFHTGWLRWNAACRRTPSMSFTEMHVMKFERRVS